METTRERTGHGAMWLEVTAGPDKGLRFELPEGECSIGRASTNTLALKDPLLSRQHCKVRLGKAEPARQDGVLELEDLDSANGTFVNGAEVKRATLKAGDEIAIGDSVLKVGKDGGALGDRPLPGDGGALGDRPLPGATRGARRSPPAEGAAPIVDLGLGGKDEDGAEEPAKPNWRPLLWAVAAVAAVATAASLMLRGGAKPEAPKIAPPPEPPLLPLQIDYEKVEADADNIFRYKLSLSPAGDLAVEIDDLAEDRHVRKGTAIPEEGLARLARRLERAGLFQVESPSAGISPNGALARQELKVAAGRRVACATVENRVAPPIFAALCEILETFGRNELGIWAIQYPAEHLVGLAQEAYTRARNLYDQRAIAHGNLHGAVKAGQEALFYLETVEPKPEFHADLLETIKTAEEELSRRYEEQRFKADRAINLKEWPTAAAELRILRELIPDEDDPRNADATRKLLDVERRQGK